MKQTVVVCLFLAACSQVSGKLKADYACELLTPGMAETFLGAEQTDQQVDEPEYTSDQSRVACTYIATGRSDLDGRVELVVTRNTNQEGSQEKAIDVLRNGTYQDAAVQEINDLGDAALWAELGNIRQLNVFVGDDYYVLSMGPTVVLEKAEELARDVLDRVDRE